MSWNGTEERIVNLANAGQVAEVKSFLAAFDLTFDALPDYTIALYRDGRMIATGSLAGEVLRNIAVDPALQSEGLMAALVGKLIAEAGRRGIFHYFVYTKPSAAHLFAALGFVEVGRAEPYAVLLEMGLGTIAEYCREIVAETAGLPGGKRAALVVNCNPFTLGHKALIAKAAAENDSVIVLVVSEEQSVFPFGIRLRLVREGVAELDNVAVLPGGKYIVSAATFPGYFTREDETVAAQTRLDAAIFAGRIAPALGISSRYIGDEPYCAVTNAYNEALREILPGYGLNVKMMRRLEIDGMPVSASRVRQLLGENKWNEIRRLVPDSTYRYLTSPEAAAVIAKVIHNHSRH